MWDLIFAFCATTCTLRKELSLSVFLYVFIKAFSAFFVLLSAGLFSLVARSLFFPSALPFLSESLFQVFPPFCFVLVFPSSLFDDVTSLGTSSVLCLVSFLVARFCFAPEEHTQRQVDGRTITQRSQQNILSDDNTNENNNQREQ